MKAKRIKIEIDANANPNVARNMEITYKGVPISGAIVSAELYLVEDNTSEEIKELIKNSVIRELWISPRREEFDKYLDELL